MNSDNNSNALSDILAILDDTPSSENPHIVQDNIDDSQNEKEQTSQGFSLPDLLSLIDMASDFLGGKDEDTQNRLTLLAALDPFIKTERKDKLDMAKTIVKISGLAKNFSKK